MKYRLLLLCLSCLCLCSACSNADTTASTDNEDTTEIATTDRETTEPTQEEAPSTNSIDDIVDLTDLSSTMLYAELYHIVESPDNYVGKTIKISGMNFFYENPDTQTMHYAVVVVDELACCAQGVEYVLADGEYVTDSEITVIGTLETYMEYDMEVCWLVDVSYVTETATE